MAKSNFTKLGTADSVISAHLNGLGDAINKVESILGMKTASKQDYALTPVADQDDVSLQYRIYECDITNWVSDTCHDVEGRLLALIVVSRHGRLCSTCNRNRTIS